MPDDHSLTAHERLRLVVDALARRDEAQARRIYEDCPDESLARLDAALDKVVGFLVLNLLMAKRQAQPGKDGILEAGKAAAQILAAARRFCGEIEIPLDQLATINPQLGELIKDFTPSTGHITVEEHRVAELLDGIRGCWDQWE